MNNKEKNFVSAVVYVHNAEDRIREFLRMLYRILSGNFEHAEIICVNDSSDDASVNKIHEFVKTIENCSLTLVNLSRFHGMEAAMNAGVDLSIGDFVFEFDYTAADYDPEMIMRIYRRALEGYDVVSAVPDRRERLSSSLFYYIFNRFTETDYRMQTEAFRVMSRRFINRIGGINRTVPYRKAVYAEAGMKTDTLVYPVSGQPEKKNDRKERRYRTALAADSLILFTDLGYRCALFMTLFMMFVSLFMLVYTVAAYLVIHPVAGWTTTVLFLSVGFLGLFGILTIVIKYLQLLVRLVFRRKQYTFESVEKLTGQEQGEDSL